MSPRKSRLEINKPKVLDSNKNKTKIKNNIKIKTSTPDITLLPSS